MPKRGTQPPGVLSDMRKVAKGGVFEGEDEAAYLRKIKPQLRAYYGAFKKNPVQFVRDLRRLESDWSKERTAEAEAAKAKAGMAAPAAEKAVAEPPDGATMRALSTIDDYLNEWKAEHGSETGGGS